MKKIILTVLSMLLIPLNIAFPQDAIYGDYLISGTQKLISLDLEGAKLVDTLKMLSQQTGLNFVSTEAVKERTLTLYLEKVPLKEAMDIIFRANNLTYEYYPDANMFVVKEMGKPTIELKTKVYHLKYVRIKSSRQQKEINVIMEPQSPTSSSGSSSSGTTSSSSSDNSNDEEDKKESGIKNVIKNILTEFGKVTEDPITNSLIVVDVPAQFPIIDEVIKNLDVPVPKVMIEVELLDVTKGLIDQIGFRYGQTLGQNDWGAAYTGPVKSTAWPLQGFIKTPASAFTYGTLTMNDFNMYLQALSTDNTTKILARPKILTLSNETAEINLTTNEAIGINTTTTETGVQTSSTERTETGTKLRVTPQVNKDTGEITLFVEVFNRNATDSDLTLTAGATGTIKNPEERGARTVLRLNNGETLLLGGLINNSNTKTISKIPLLGDIPFVGKAFTYKDDNRSERELLVFMTPRIVEDTPVMAASGKILPREVGYSRREVMSIAMDKYSR
jgi:type IV pilus assembly protein PilQ